MYKYLSDRIDSNLKLIDSHLVIKLFIHVTLPNYKLQIIKLCLLFFICLNYIMLQLYGKY